MTLLIFSCNRALQLQTLLRSLSAYLTVENACQIHVIYAATDDTFDLGYQQVKQEFMAIRFHRERSVRRWVWPRPMAYWKNGFRYIRQSGLRRTTDFKALTEQIIADSPYEGTLFLTDDSLFIRPTRLDAARTDIVLRDPNSAYTLSFRHGLTFQPKPADSRPFAEGGFCWHVSDSIAGLGQWTWRFSVDGHLYPRRALLPILRKLHYANPNSLEGFVNEYIRNVRPDLFRTLLFNEQPSLVGFILNKVQTYNGNSSLDVSPAFLNQKLLDGYQLTYRYQQPATDFQPILYAIDLLNKQTGASERLVIDA